MMRRPSPPAEPESKDVKIFRLLLEQTIAGKQQWKWTHEAGVFELSLDGADVRIHDDGRLEILNGGGRTAAMLTSRMHGSRLYAEAKQSALASDSILDDVIGSLDNVIGSLEDAEVKGNG